MKKNKNYVDLKDQPVPEGQHLLEVDDLKMYFHHGPYLDASGKD